MPSTPTPGAAPAPDGTSTPGAAPWTPGTPPVASFVTTDGARIAYTDSGPVPAPGRTVVLVAGYAMPATAWALQSDALLADGHRVVAVDRRSTGESDDVAWGQRVSRHGADLHELLELLDLRDVVVVGQSMGASSVWALVDAFGTDRLAGVVTIDQTPKMVNADGWDHGFYGMTADDSGSFFEDGIPDTGRGARVDEARPGVARLVERIGGMPAVRQANAPETRRLLRDHGLQDWRDVVARLDVPFVMVAGRDSQLWPCTHAEAAVGSNAHGTAVVIEQAGHATNLDRPDEFDAVLREFLARL
ncbi:pimeloyl-ACP methyl ester carboxylesterase [Frigoribacterium sp. PhB160]|uniref:alpha/beta fold hydrolase n=1 Tax=Frigoribacterium sp. PhB160 TaxID=2485192 RepID=UPI000F475177|nr:alpha/beta hydrolase [Frigoribacterium sp. PhB160]ROS61375.1 pimeloyl-ACP methyl ester carboxylesterase [Frigoribacterium sp. PhB160]